MSTYLHSSREALKLQSKGKSTQEIKAKLGLRYAQEVHSRIAVAKREEDFLEPKLTHDELDLIIHVGRAQLRQLERGEICSPKLKYCSPPFWRVGKSKRVAQKRIHLSRSDGTTGIGLLCAYHGGYVYLTPAGWALFHAIEAERQKGGAS